MAHKNVVLVDLIATDGGTGIELHDCMSV